MNETNKHKQINNHEQNKQTNKHEQITKTNKHKGTKILSSKYCLFRKINEFHNSRL